MKMFFSGRYSQKVQKKSEFSKRRLFKADSRNDKCFSSIEGSFFTQFILKARKQLSA